MLHQKHQCLTCKHGHFTQSSLTVRGPQGFQTRTVGVVMVGTAPGRQLERQRGQACTSQCRELSRRTVPWGRSFGSAQEGTQQRHQKALDP